MGKISLPLPDGINKVGIAFDKTAGLMAISVGGVWSADTPYNESFGTGQMALGANMANLYRHDIPLFADQKARVDDHINGTDFSDYEIVATDGVNEVSHPMPEGVNKIGVVYDQAGNKLNLNANGAWGADQPFAGLPAGNLDVEGGYRALQGYNLSFDNGKDKIDEIIAGTAPPPPIPSAMIQLGCDQTLANYQNGRYRSLSIGEGEYKKSDLFLTTDAGELLVDDDGNYLTEA